MNQSRIPQIEMTLPQDDDIFDKQDIKEQPQTKPIEIDEMFDNVN